MSFGPGSFMPSTSAIRAEVERNPGLRNALCALSFFRTRHHPGRSFPSGRPAESNEQARRDRFRLCRLYIRDARACQWRGSVTQAIAILGGRK